MSAYLARALRRLCVVVCLGAAALGAPLASTASAIETKRDRAGDMRAKGLSGAERRALDIVKVSAVGGPELGVVVTASFRGNLERRIGRGGLKRAVVALVLRPKSRRQRPSAIATDRRGHFGRTRRRTSSDVALVRRDGRRVTFLLLGPGLQNVRSIAVAAFASPPGAGRRGSARTSQLLTSGFINEVIEALAGDRDESHDEVTIGFDEESGLPIMGIPCPTLERNVEALQAEERELTAEIARARAQGRRAGVRRLEMSRRMIRGHIQRLRDQITSRCGPTPQPGGPDRTCAFDFSKTSPDNDFLISWRCDQVHGQVDFNFNGDIASIRPDVGNAMPPTCQISSVSTSRITCQGDFEAGQTYIFAMESTTPRSCPAFVFDPTVDGRALSQVACSG